MDSQAQSFMQQIKAQLPPEMLQQIAQQAAQQAGDALDSPQEIDQVLQLMHYMLDHPDQYEQILQELQRRGAVDEGDMPPQFDLKVIVTFILVLEALRDNLTGRAAQLPAAPQQQQLPAAPQQQQLPAAPQQQQFARGGLAQVANQLQGHGRHGDTLLAHINPEEARLLKSMGGSGTRNPQTGLLEFGLFSSIASAFKSVVSVAAPVVGGLIGSVVPGIGTAIGTAIGGAIGGVASGGGVKGALLGAATGFIGGGGLGNTISGALGTMAPGLTGALGSMGTNMLGNALVGGAMGALTGQGFGKGALTGAVGSGLGQLGANYAGTMAPGALQSGLGAAAQALQNYSMSGMTPRQAVLASGLTGIAQGLGYGRSSADTSTAARPATASGDTAGGTTASGDTAGGYQVGKGGDFSLAQSPTSSSLTLGGATQPPPAPQPGIMDSLGLGNLSLADAGKGLLLTSLLGGAQTPQQVQQTVQQDPRLQQYMNKPLEMWDWQAIQAQAQKAGMPLGDYVAQNWGTLNTTSAPLVGGGTVGTQAAATAAQPAAMARGGLSRIAMLAQGGGSGRDDTIPARLSDGEYVIDAETVALLGDGSTKEGARLLDMMRQQIRKQKGKSLARGKISPNAKSPLAYLRGV